MIFEAHAENVKRVDANLKSEQKCFFITKLPVTSMKQGTAAGCGDLSLVLHL